MAAATLTSLLLLLLLTATSCIEASLMQISRGDKQSILDAHNRLRVQTANGRTPGQPPAANMKLVEWDDRLEQKAQMWVSRCAVGHDNRQSRLIEGYSWVGQNFAAGGTRNFATYVQRWFDEYKVYSYSSKACGRVCGHYTQVVWANTLLIGCAVARCSGYPYHIVCNYAPGGNVNGGRPYVSGSPASQCEGQFSFAENGVCVSRSQCSSSGACRCTVRGCRNGGRFDAASCSCRCPSGYYGAQCENVCQDAPGWEYTCRVRGYSDCGNYGRVCHKTCNLCQAAGADSNAVNSNRLVARANA